MLALPTMMVADYVVHGKADFGVVHQPTDSPYLDGELICEGEGICVLPRGHPLASRKSIGVEDLGNERLVCYREDTAVGSLFRRALAGTGYRREIDYVINQSQQALDIAEAGVAIAITDPFMLAAAPREEVVAVPFRPRFPSRERIIRMRERPRSRAGKELERAIRETILEITKRSALAGLFRAPQKPGAQGVQSGRTRKRQWK